LIIIFTDVYLESLGFNLDEFKCKLIAFDVE